MKLTLILGLTLSFPIAAQTYKEAAHATCLSLGLSTFNKSLESFPKFKELLDRNYNFTLAVAGIKPLASTMNGTLISEEFNETYYEMMKTATETNITDEQLKGFQTKLAKIFERDRSSYMQKCQKIVETDLQTCKINLQSKEMTPAQKICFSKMMNKFEPLFKDISHDHSQNHEEAVKADEKLLEAIKANKDEQTLAHLFMTRLKISSHMPSVLPMTLNRAVEYNATNFKGYLFAILKDAKPFNEVKNAFVDKTSLIEKSLKHKDLIYFSTLIKAGWLDAKEKKALAAKIKNPEAINILTSTH